MSQPAPFVLGPTGLHKATVIFLHGRGGDGESCAPIFQPTLPQTKYIFSNAPIIPITVCEDEKMPAWYDKLDAIKENAKEDVIGIQNSCRYVHELLGEEEKAGVPPEAMIVAGFSKGAAIALRAGLSYKNKLGGILAISGYFPLRHDFPSNGTPLLQLHGAMDHVVPVEFARAGFDLLHSTASEFREYTGVGHTVSRDMANDSREFIRQKFAADL